ncbi:MAG: AI-2E family transporter [Bacteroidota bacterium]
MSDPDTTRKASEVALLIAGVALLFVLVYLIIPVLSPFVLVAAIVFLLYPARHVSHIRRLIWLAIFLFIVWFLYTASGVLTPFIIAFLLAYILNPLVNLLEKRNIPRWTSSLLLMLIFLASIVGSAILLMPILIIQFRGLIESISSIARDAIGMTKEGKLFDVLVQYGVPIEQIREIFEKEFPSKLESILKSVLEGAFGLITGISSLITQVLNVIIMPIVTFYLLKDFPQIIHKFKTLLPESRRESTSAYFVRIDEMLGHYFRGAIFVAIIQGIISTVVLSLLGVQYALVLGIMTAILDFIPYVGLLISLVVSSVVALLSGEPTTMKVVGVVLMYLSQKIVENTILAPRIIGSKVGLHPVLLILSLLIFGYFLGFVGLLIAVPTTAVIVLSFNLWEENKLAEAKARQATE